MIWIEVSSDVVSCLQTSDVCSIHLHYLGDFGLPCVLNFRRGPEDELKRVGHQNQTEKTHDRSTRWIRIRGTPWRPNLHSIPFDLKWDHGTPVPEKGRHPEWGVDLNWCREEFPDVSPGQRILSSEQSMSRPEISSHHVCFGMLFRVLGTKSVRLPSSRKVVLITCRKTNGERIAENTTFRVPLFNLFWNVSVIKCFSFITLSSTLDYFLFDLVVNTKNLL